MATCLPLIDRKTTTILHRCCSNSWPLTCLAPTIPLGSGVTEGFTEAHEASSCEKKQRLVHEKNSGVKDDDLSSAEEIFSAFFGQTQLKDSMSMCI